MNYKMRTPCDACPFRRGNHFPSARQILMQDGEFPCHKTAVVSEETGDFEATDKSAHCAGFLIMREKMGNASQMMRIAERIGMYDAKALMTNNPATADVFGSLAELSRPRKRGPRA